MEIKKQGYGYDPMAKKDPSSSELFQFSNRQTQQKPSGLIMEKENSGAMGDVLDKMIESAVAKKKNRTTDTDPTGSEGM